MMKKTHEPDREKKRLSEKAGRAFRSIALTLAVIALVFALNRIMTGVEEKFALKLDLSRNGRFSITEDTRKMLSSLEETVHIYTLFQENVQSDLRTIVTEMLTRYAAGGNVTVKNLDIVANPASAARFRTEGTELSTNSVIVASGDDRRFRVIPGARLFEYEVDPVTQEFTRYDFVGEQAVNTAIYQVTGTEGTRIYLLQGHGEAGKDQMRSALAALEEQNFSVSELFLSQSTPEAGNGNVLLVIEPKRDLSEEEFGLLNAFLENGGSLYYACSYGSRGLERFDALLSGFCLAADPGLLIENVGSTGYYYRNQLYLMPDIRMDDGENSPFDRSFDETDYVVLPQSRSVRRVGIRPAGLQMWDLLMTSPYSYVKSELNADEGLQQSKKDEMGSFSVAAAAEYEKKNGRARVFVIGNALFLTNDAMFEAYSNDKLLLSPVNWLVGREGKSHAAGRSMGADRLMIPDNRVYQLLCVALIGVLPLTCVVSGLLVWRKRRRR